MRCRDSFLAGLRELQTLAEQDAWVYLGNVAELGYPERDFAQYTQTLLAREFIPARHFVPDVTYWALRGEEMVGRISLRLELNEFLKREGGHIGYVVRPSFRGNGIATSMLEQILKTPHARQIGRLLLTCDENNLASERTILKNGGIFESAVDVTGGRPRKKRFWIETAL